VSRFIKAEAAAVSRFLVRHPKLSRFIAHIPGASRFLKLPAVGPARRTLGEEGGTKPCIAPVYNAKARPRRAPKFRF